MKKEKLSPRVLFAPLMALALLVPLAPAEQDRFQGPATPPPPADRSAELWELLNEHVDHLLRMDPVGVGATLADERYNAYLPDVSPEATERDHNEFSSRLEKLRSMERSGWTPEDRLDAELLEHDLALAIQGIAFHEEQMPVTSIRGPQYWLPQLGTFAPTRTLKHRSDYVRRLTRVDWHIEGVIEQMRMGMQAGRVPPRVVVEPAVEQALAQCAEEIASNPTKSPFYEPFAGLPRDMILARRAQAAIRDGIVPAYRRLAEFLRDEYLPACRESFGISEGVDGPAAYDYTIRRHTTLPLTADEVHETGLAEVARIRAEMLDTIARTDFPKKDSLEGDALFEAFLEYLRTDERFYYEEAEDLLAGYRNISKLIDAELPRLFGVLPRLPYGVKAIADFAAPSSPAAYYYNGSLEGGQAGYFMANTYGLDQRPTYGMTALTLHEAVPGHHLQIALAQEMERVHPYRTLLGYTAYVEGWALYSERLGLEVGDVDVPEWADDDGLYRGLYADPYQDFGRLSFEMWRAMRLVVDTGIHAKGWSRQDAIDFMLANGGNSKLDTANEVDRYIGWPGQALGYKIGELKIRELRARAEQQLGKDFDIREFHDVVLGAGALPLPILERRVEAWLQP